MALSPGTRLGPYEILAPLGAGGHDFTQLHDRLAELVRRFDRRARGPRRPVPAGSLTLASVVEDLRDLFTRDVTQEGLRDLVRRDPRAIYRFYTAEIDFAGLARLPRYRRRIEDCQRGCDRWNKVIERAGIAHRLTIPSRRFHRQVGIYAGAHFAPDGALVSEEEWNRRRDAWLPSDADRAHVDSRMQPVYEPGKIANWIAPPDRGINGNPFDFEYVRFAPR